MGSNSPGKKREQLNYLKGVGEYDRVCRRALEGWVGFDLVR